MHRLIRRTAAVMVVALAAATAAAQIPKPFGNFVATRTVDPANGRSTATAFSNASDPRHVEAAVAWRCMADGLNVIYLFGAALGSEQDRAVDVESRVDTDAPTSDQEWTLMEGHRAAFLPMTHVEAFTSRAMEGRTLTLQATDPRNGTTYTDQFRLEGLSAALHYILPCAT